MKEKISSRKILNEALWAHLAAFAVEEIIRGSGIGLRTSLSESEFISLFQKKYALAIKSAEKVFSDMLATQIKIQPVDFFSLENIIKEVGSGNPETLRESSKNIGLGSLERLIFESSIKYAVGGLSDRNKLVTSQVEFKWGKYNYPDPEDVNFENKSRIASSNYWIKEGESDLGEIQFKGDPFTYRDAGGGKLEVISAPGSENPETGRPYRESIGNTFSRLEKNEDLGGSVEANLVKKLLSDPRLKTSDEEIERIESEFREDAITAEQQKRKDFMLRKIDEDTSNGSVSVFAWIALNEQAGIDFWIQSLIYNIKLTIRQEGLIKSNPKICMTRLGMVMVILAEKINIVGRRSIENFKYGKDPIFDDEMGYSLGDEILNVEPFIAYIEAIKDRIVDTLLAEFVPVANMTEYEEDNADDPANYISAFFGSRDRCGYLVDPDSTGSYGRPDNTFNVEKAQDEMRKLINRQKERIRAELEAKKKREEAEMEDMDRDTDSDIDQEVPEIRDETDEDLSPEDSEEIERIARERGYIQ